MFLNLVFIAGGLYILISSANFLVKGATSIATRFKISTLVIGLTIVSFSTSAPELVVNVVSALEGAPDLAIANVVGSNIANILLALGVTAIIINLEVKESTVWREIPLALLGVVLLFLLIQDGEVSVNDGLILITLLGVFLYYIFAITKTEHETKAVKAEVKRIQRYGNLNSIIYTIGGSIGLVIGGRLLVDGSIEVAQTAGLSETFIGITVVALGTSLPELATSIVAVKKGEDDIAIGNIIGSNIFNIFWIIGLTGIIHPLTINPVIKTDIIILFFATLLLFGFMFIGKKHALTRKDGIGFLTLYAMYIVFIFIRG